MAFIKDANARLAAGEEELKFYQDNIDRDLEYLKDPANNPWRQKAEYPIDHPTVMKNAPANDMFANPKEGAGITVWAVDRRGEDEPKKEARLEKYGPVTPWPLLHEARPSLGS